MFFLFIDLIREFCTDYPALIDYLGFFEEDMEIEKNEQGDDPEIYEKYWDVEHLISAIKSADLFQGKLSIDRNNYEQGRFRFH